MRRKLLIGNWKMHKTTAEARAFAEQLGRLSTRLPAGVDYVVCPPFTALHVLRVILPSAVRLGAQNAHPAPQGAFTGEVSVPMLAELGVAAVIAGHSERRQMFGDTDDLVRQKVKAIADAGLTPVLCVGENLAERQAGRTFDVIERQVRAGLADLTPSQTESAVVAYEPVWAIGTGQAATAEDAQAVIGRIRRLVAELHGPQAAAAIRILYGGSVKPDNIASFTVQPDIDGALVGGASLEAESFVAMAEAIARGGKPA
jgi:triosephosphate isomerase